MNVFNKLAVISVFDFSFQSEINFFEFVYSLWQQTVET